MKQIHKVVLGAALVLIPVTFSSASMTDPFFKIDTPAAWQAALTSGAIAAITDYSFISDVYPDSASSFVVPTLTVTSTGLDANYGADVNGIGGFAYDYAVDPDLQGRTIKVKVKPPRTGGEFKITVRDTSGRGKVFTFKSNVEPWAEMNLTIPVDATKPADAGAEKIEETNGTDKTDTSKVRYIWFGYGPNGRETGNNVEYALVELMPEPGTLAMLAAGGLLVRRRK